VDVSTLPTLARCHDREVTSHAPAEVAAVAEEGWRWVLDQVTWDGDGPCIPAAVADDGTVVIDEGRPTGMHSGVGGLAHTLAEIRLTRDWSAEERRLAEGIAARVRAGVPDSTVPDFFDGLVSDIGVLTALGVAGADAAVRRLDEIAGTDGWPQNFLSHPYTREARLSDATLGTASVLLGALWAERFGVAGARDLAGRAADVLMAEAEEELTGLNWRFVPLRFHETTAAYEMPNWSHGLAGIATAVALAGAGLDRPDLVEAARRGAEHLVTLGDSSDHGLRIPTQVPRPDELDGEVYAFGWCHGGAGTSRLFPALERAGVESIAAEPARSWQRRSLHSVRTSGLPERLRPGFWDNDGRCCGTVGVGEAFLDAWQCEGDPDDLAFALVLADTLVDRAYRDGPHAWWRFVEHRKPEPLLPPGVGWMQGAAGIAAYLFRVARVARDGREATTAARMDNWWALPDA
jgi:hypothetical protein